MEENILRCPNCGATISNTKNCEYCGSLLVRFLGTDINLAQTSYLDNSKTSLSLLRSLKQNLKMQQSSMDVVVTDIFHHNDKNQYDLIVSVMRNGDAVFADGSPISLESRQGLCIVLGFDDIVKNSEARKKHNQFKSLDCYLLFDEHVSVVDKASQWTKSKNYEYYIDFGNDAEGAARLISDIITNLYGVSIESLECHTNQGPESIMALRAELGYVGRSLRQKILMYQDNNPKVMIFIVILLWIFILWQMFSYDW